MEQREFYLTVIVQMDFTMIKNPNAKIVRFNAKHVSLGQQIVQLAYQKTQIHLLHVIVKKVFIMLVINA